MERSTVLQDVLEASAENTSTPFLVHLRGLCLLVAFTLMHLFFRNRKKRLRMTSRFHTNRTQMAAGYRKSRSLFPRNHQRSIPTHNRHR